MPQFTDFEIIRHHIVNTVTIHISLDIAVFVDNRVSKTIAQGILLAGGVVLRGIISLNICESGVVVLGSGVLRVRSSRHFDRRFHLLDLG